MAQDASGFEPLVSQIPTNELRRTLTDRIARDAADAAARRILRPLTFFGLPGVVLVGTMVWQLLDSAVSGKVSAARTELTREITNSITQSTQSFIQNRFEVLDARTANAVRSAVEQAFAGQQAGAVRDALRRHTEAADFRAELGGIVLNEMRIAWNRSSDELRSAFLQEMMQKEEFRRIFALDVERALAEGASVSRILSGALSQTIQRRPEGGNHAVALNLLASMDQGAANRVVFAMLGAGGNVAERDAALQALVAVGFQGLPPGAPTPAPSAMLDAALTAWSEHCTAYRCGPDQPVTRAMAAFLTRGRGLAGRDGESWVLALKLWHEALVADHDKPSREASLGLVPAALGAIASPDAVRVLTGWFSSSDTELALSAAVAMNALPAEAFSDADRHAFFRTLWPTVAGREGVRPALEEAIWMALGIVSRGQASAIHGSFRAEAGLLRQMSDATEARSDLTDWMDESGRGVRYAALRGRVLAPPSDPCALTTTPTVWRDEFERPTQLRANLCALAALVRPARGLAEWNALRPALVQREQVALLGVVWTLATDAARDLSEAAIAARFAPLTDLLMSQSPAPAEFQLAAMLMLRTVPDRPAWTAIERLGPDFDAHQALQVATRWLYRPGQEDKAWFIDRLRAMPESFRAGALAAMASAVLREPIDDRGLPTNLRALAREFALRSTLAGFNALYVAETVDPAAARAAIEGAGSLPALAAIVSGTRRVSGIRPADAERLKAALLANGGWSGAITALDGLPAQNPGEAFRMVHEGRFGHVSLQEGGMVALAASRRGGGGGPLTVTFFNPATLHMHVVREGAHWRIGGNDRRSGGSGTWLYRVNGSAPGSAELRLEPASIGMLEAAPSAEGAARATMQPGRPFRIRSLPESPEATAGQGWLRLEGLAAGTRLRVTTYDLDERVDTTVALFQPSGARLGSNDDIVGGLASSLEIAVARAEPLLLRLQNIGTAGSFTVHAEIVD